MPRVLVVEDSRLFGSLVKRKIELELGFEVHWAQTYSQAREMITARDDFLISLLDLNLPDAPMGEIVDLVLAKNIPAIVFTGTTFGNKMRETIWSYKVIDYVLKESSHNIDYIASLVRRIHLNKSIKVLVVDDSVTSRIHVADLLKVHHYQVFEAADGTEALKILQNHPDIKLVITDYNMPRMNGFQLTEEIRDKYGKGELAVIGMSAQGDNILSARFIKNGANDFINKPFLAEEFYCRITQNIEMIEQIQAIRDSSNKDYLTGLHNRRYFFHVGEKLFANARRGNISLTVALIDIDHFKKINDTYGHDAGDIVLKQLSQLLRGRFRESDTVARFGGEEFCVMAADMEAERVFEIFDHLRRTVEKTDFLVESQKIPVTISIGVCDCLGESLDSMIKQADEMLYEAKRGGRNQVVLAPLARVGNEG